MKSFNLRIIPVTPYVQNCSLLICRTTNLAAVVDPGGDLAIINQAITESGAKVEKILLTHGHLDHCGGAKDLSCLLGVPIIGPHKEDAFWIDQLPRQSQMFGFAMTMSFVPDQWLNDGDTVNVGQEILQVLHCPGHTPGHVVFYSASDKLALVGDVLFAGSIGRSDFPRGNHAELINSIKHKLWPLGNDVAFVPGHGPMSTFGQERISNPYVKDK